MKIALVKRRYSVRAGGSERYCVMLARQLQSLGHDVTVIGETIDEELSADVKFVRVRVNRATSWTGNLSFARNCERAVHGGRFDVVYGLGRAFGLDAVRVTERIQSHWLNVYYKHPANRFLQRLNPRHRTLIDLERSIFRSLQVRRIVTQSRLDRRLLVEYYGVPEEKLITIYNGVDTETFNPAVREHAWEVRKELGISRDEPLLVFASMDFEGKGLRSILHALQATRHQDARLLVLGKGRQRKFARIARNLGVDDRVLFLGRRSDIQQYYAAGDLFVLPTAYEPFPNVNLESMACGSPVITTATAGGADLIQEGQNGYLIPQMGAVDELTACLDNHFSLSKDQRQRVSHACWQTAREMTLERNARRTAAMLEEVFAEKNDAMHGRAA